MSFDYELWRKRHTECVLTVQRFCELDKRSDAKERSVKCNSALCVMKNAMQDIRGYFQRDERSSAELCFLIRNIDVIVAGILDINNILFGIGLNRADKAIERCFTNKEIISKFRTLRSMILAHPVDTHYVNDKGESEIVYLEDVRPFNPSIDGLLIKKKCDYVKQMCRPESNSSFFEPLSISTEIVPVVDTIIDTLEMLASNTEKEIYSLERGFAGVPLELNKESLQEYILSLDRELEKRYPSAVEIIEFENNETSRYSIVLECLMYFNTNFKEDTKSRYDLFLKYIKSELCKIEEDLQKMEFNEDKYFQLLYHSDFAAPHFYEQEKMGYLRESNERSYTEESIGNDTQSNALWGIRCFRILLPYICKYIPVDLSVSDRELYCQYLAAIYLYNIDAIGVEKK